MKYDRSVHRSFALLGQFGINMLVPILLCSFVGNLLDKKFETDFIMIIMFFIGAVSGGYNVYRLSKRHLRQTNPDSPYIHGAKDHELKNKGGVSENDKKA